METQPREQGRIKPQLPLDIKKFMTNGGAEENAAIREFEIPQNYPTYPKLLSFFIPFFGQASTVFCINLDNTIVSTSGHLVLY